jgi:hypothetical protein
VAGTDPLDADDVLSVSISVNADGAAVLDWPGATGRLYNVYRGTNPSPGTWTCPDGGSNLPGTAGSMVFTNSAPPSPAYYRVGVREDP